MEFSSKYHEDAFSDRCASKHGESLSRRLNDRREQRLLARCLELTEGVKRVADIGCGPGRFWPTLAYAATGDMELFGLDVSESMLRCTRDRFADRLGGRFGLASGSVLALPFVDGAFDCVVSMRLLHHFGEVDDRQRALSELARVSSRYLIVSLWTDGSFKALRRMRLENRRGPREYQNRFIVPRAVLDREFQSAGLSAIGHYDLIPGYSQWRYYVLEKRGVLEKRSVDAGAGMSP